MFGDGSLKVWTVGHSTRSLEEFLGLLREHRIELLADVRHFPSSRHVPWANGAALASALETASIRYGHFVDLGGYRKPQPESTNTGWRNAGFRGYADHMTTPAFVKALDGLLEAASERRTAIMCAEAIPWKCHRSILSDALVARGVRVVHILSPGKAEDHRLTSFAKVRGSRVTYPGGKGKTLKRPRG